MFLPYYLCGVALETVYDILSAAEEIDEIPIFQNKAIATRITDKENKSMNNIYSRVSIRKYLEESAEKEKTEALLRAAMQAPSAANQSRS